MLTSNRRGQVGFNSKHAGRNLTVSSYQSEGVAEVTSRAENPSCSPACLMMCLNGTSIRSLAAIAVHELQDGAVLLMCRQRELKDCLGGEMSYYIYENWTHERARIHKSNCGFCNNGAAKQSARSDRNGQWHGPFEREEAFAKASTLGCGDVRPCPTCDP